MFFLPFAFFTTLLEAFDHIYPLRGDSFGPFLYLGSHADALNTDGLRLLRIKHILLIGKRDVGLKTLDTRHDRAFYEYIEVENQIETRHYEAALDWLTRAMDKVEALHFPGGKIAPENVLIVSARGCQRAGSIATAFLIRRIGLDVSSAAKEVSKRRGCFTRTKKLLSDIKAVDYEPDVPTTAEEIAESLLVDQGRKVHARSLSEEDLEKCLPTHETFWYYGDIPSPTGSVYWKANSTMSCCEICDAHPDCLHWSFGLADLHEHKCYLRSGDGSYMESRPHFVSGDRAAPIIPIEERTEDKYKEL